MSFIDRVYGRGHPHFLEFDKVVDGNSPTDLGAGVAILEAIRDEISGGWLFDLRSLITAEVFSDFLEMAQHLLNTGYKDPAAVMAGSVLEEHLRQLCIIHDVPIDFETDENAVPKKADRLNSDLAKADIYSKIDQKAVTNWFGIRNSAAHRKYEEYSKEQIVNMLKGITEFMSRVPA